MKTSCHARKRCAQRNLAPAEIDLVRRYGRKLHRTGIVFYFLGRRDLPEALRKEARYARLEGTILLVSLDGILITSYRNKKGLPKIRKKDKRRSRPGWSNRAVRSGRAADWLPWPGIRRGEFFLLILPAWRRNNNIRT